ncbi:hypothetical protein DFH28DRAFT_894181 [Melampsora americana]|nr:hypothetical protein DFH28DRAFT_894181 [Melampsora americana]
MIANPEVRTNVRGRPRLDSQKKGSQTSTARFKSNFEILEEQNKRTYSCSKCHRRGHRANNCTPALADALARHPMPNQPAPPQHSKKQATYKCSKCKVAGHRANSCPENKRTDTKQDPDIDKSDSNLDSYIDKTDHNSPESDDSFDLKWKRDLWGADDQPKCPLCDEPLPEKPSKKFKEMLRFQLAKPHAKKRPLPGNPEAVDLPVCP